MHSKKPVFYLTVPGGTDTDGIARQKEALAQQGYRVITLWEGSLPPEECIEKILQNRFCSPDSRDPDICSGADHKEEETC